jgi:hypothetical protein
VPAAARKAANAGLRLPDAVTSPDCQRDTSASSRSRNHSRTSMRASRRAIATALFKYAACFAHETPNTRSGGFVW